MSGDKIEVENINTPGRTERVDLAKYDAMRAAMLSVMSDRPMTAKDIKTASLSQLPDALFPGGATAGWWMKCVQLDLEAKQIIQRHTTRPLTFSLCP